MRSIAVCVGSSCHLKGAYDVIAEFQHLITLNKLETTVELKGCFCLGECRDGVSVAIEGQIYTSLTKATAAAFFNEHFCQK